jgi:hypothetical protein
MLTYEILVTQPGYDEDPANGEGAMRITVENGTGYVMKTLLTGTVFQTGEVTGAGVATRDAIAECSAWDGESDVTIDLAGHRHAVKVTRS